jgi:glycosyltransferase involved in cell wall biosynthesis
MSDSIHTARWINQLNGQGWDLHLFPSIDYGGTHSEFRNITVHHSLYGKQKDLDQSVKLRGIPVGSKEIAYLGRTALNRICPAYRAFQLRRLIKKLHPDIIHSIEIQAAGYLTSEVKKKYVGKFPTWIVTNWGNDIYLFGRLSEHENKIKEVLASCDYYSCECQRDVQLAQQMGLRGEVLPVLPNAGGFDLTRVAQFRQPGPTSTRRLILLKGYQDWHGRALVGLRAIEICADALRGYRVGIYVANPDVKIAAELVSKSTGIPIEIIPYCSHDDMLRHYGQARVYIGLSISDGISISELEAIVMGAFPIQSCTACADEWITDGQSGFIVPPEDPEPVAEAIRRAVSDDMLVDRAAELNAQVARERLDQAVIKPQVVAIYQKVAEAAKNKRSLGRAST